LNKCVDINLNASGLERASALVFGVVFAEDAVEIGRDAETANMEGILLLFIFRNV
jgi:hypothetical protein